jgi:amino acid adenylation domain-containing protein
MKVSPALTPERIMRWAEVQPDRPAVVAGREIVTYAELARRATELAGRLREVGVARDVPVAIHLDRSANLVCASLGAMLAGGGYLILDPGQPDRRLTALLAGSGARALIIDGDPPAGLADRDIAVVDVAAGRPDVAPDLPAVAPADLCYVNYTSGSSGTPKAVAIQHGGLANLVKWYQDAYQVGPGDHTTQFAQPSFDAYALEVWTCLANGATLHLCDGAVPGSPTALRDWLVAERITVCFAATPLAEELLELSWPRDIALRAMLTGGDRLHRHPPADLPFRLYNNYGPTEVTVVSTWCEVPRGGPREVAPPIGRALPNLRAYVLDAEQRTVAEEEPGELYVSGVGVARGYLGRPDLTAERFFDDPYHPGARMYATGDLVRRRPDGMLDFLGRVDEQIELRGYRIEPAEIEAVLRRHPGVRDTAVVLAAGDVREQLVAFIVPATPGGTPADVQEFAAEELPRYMVPTALVTIAQLPVTARGKVDRRELERQAKTAAQATAAGSDTEGAPRTPTERLLARLWSEVLDVAEVQRQDSFFDLGGDSLLAIRLARRATEHGLVLGAADLLDHERLHELAAALDRVAGTS